MAIADTGRLRNRKITQNDSAQCVKVIKDEKMIDKRSVSVKKEQTLDIANVKFGDSPP